MKKFSILFLLLFVALSGRRALAGPEVLPVSSPRGDAVEHYVHLARDHTRTFKIPGPKAASLDSGVSNWMMGVPMLMDSALIGMNAKVLGTSMWPGAILAADSLLGDLAAMKLMKNIDRDFSPATWGGNLKGSTLSVTWWDPALVNAKTLHYAVKEVVGSLSEIESYRASLLSEYPVDEEVVFEVKIANGSAASLQFSPFSWHFYLVDAQGRRHKALSYDPELDQEIGPQQTVTGKVYFPRVDPATGADLTAGGVSALLEDIGGKTFRFSFR